MKRTIIDLILCTILISVLAISGSKFRGIDPRFIVCTGAVAAVIPNIAALLGKARKKTVFIVQIAFMISMLLVQVSIIGTYHIINTIIVDVFLLIPMIIALVSKHKVWRTGIDD